MPTPYEQLESLRNLPENWDGYGGAAPLEAAIDFAQAFVGFLEAALRQSRSTDRVVHINPTRVGGILVEWEDQTIEHEVEINSDLCLSFLHLNKATGEIVTRSFSPGAPTAVDPGLLQELRQLLAA